MAPANDPAPADRFTRLYAAHHGAVHAYVVSRAGRQLAEEVVNDTFTVAWRRLPDVPEHALPWLLVVARNVLRERYREAARQESLAAEFAAWTAAGEGSGADVAEQVVERAAVLRALAALADADRELLTLVAWHGLAARDAARVVGCSPATFFVRLHRARRRLQRALDAGSGAEAGVRIAPAPSPKPAPKSGPDHNPSWSPGRPPAATARRPAGLTPREEPSR